MKNSKKWIEAGILLSKNPTEIITCPDCNTGTLLVKDEPLGKLQIDRYIICNFCGHWNVITLTASLKLKNNNDVGEAPPASPSM